MAAQPVALCLQDTGTLDFNGQDIDGLGPLQLRVLRRLEIALALYVVVAWRINRMVRLGRHQPDLEASLLFDVDEIAAAYTMNRSRRLAGESRLPVQVRCKTSIVDAAPLHSTDIATLCTQRFHQML